jgi:hypothetical protein
MSTLIRVVAGVLLVAHGLVHLLYLVPAPADESFPFTLDESWLVPENARRPVAVALIAATIVSFALLGLAVWGVPGLAGAWPGIAVTAAATSLALLIAFWDAQLTFGVVLDLAIVAIALTRPDWTSAL